MLSPDTLAAIQRALSEEQLDGWLLFEFRGLNPIAMQMLGIRGLLTRRIFVFVPREGVPTAITHNIEQHVWRDWPAAWGRERYSAWRELEALLQKVVAGKRIAMEYSPGNAVPFLDRVPAGVVELLRSMGATIASSGELVSRFTARWNADQLASHKRAAEHIRRFALDTLMWIGAQVRAGHAVYEHEAQERLLTAFAGAGLETYAPPNVSAGSNAADPHYEPSASRPRRIAEGDTVLIDLWAREPAGVYADQTYMASVGPPSAKALEIWAAIREARDAALVYLERALATGSHVSGAGADDAAREVIVRRGFGDYFTHRTGHNIDGREVHGSGPNLDNLETRDMRALIDGVGFSVEPGIYLRGEIGMRTEVNCYIDGRALVVTPNEIQHDLLQV